MFHSTAFDIAAFVAAIYLLSPVAVRWTYRFSAHCAPREVSLDVLPSEIADEFRKSIPELQELGFELIGCFDCGQLAEETRSYLAYFCNRLSNDFASISTMTTPSGIDNYLEFSTTFKSGLTVESNTNSVLPLTPDNPEIKVFRFPTITDARTLLHTHHRLIDKYAAGLWAQAEPYGEEIQRYVRVIENYGPRHARIAYMYPTEDGGAYKLTWKGAFLITWRGLWPVSLVRRWMQHQTMQTELQTLEARPVTAFQKA